jgi:hypothetical protein
LLNAGEEVFSELKNLCVWNKTNGGMGTFYRSKHELVFVFKVGMAPHLNTFGLGENGRYRTNVWAHDSPHFQMTPKASAKTGSSARIVANRSINGSKRNSGMVGINS